jgi:hypothetical protein
MISFLHRVNLLSNIGLFNDLNSDQLVGVAAKLEERELPAKQVVYKVGDKADGFYIIYKGEVYASRFPIKKGDQVTKLLVKGDYFGEEVTEERNRLATFIVVEDCILLFLSRQNFEDLLVLYPVIKNRLGTFKSPFYKQLLQYFTSEKDFVLNESIPSNEINKSDRPLRVFLCHSSNDKPAVRELYQKLTMYGIDVWLDEKKLLGGQKWKLEIPKAVREADAVIICLSKTSINKEGYVQREIKFALDLALEKPEGTIYLIPARLEECKVPDSLSEWQWINLFDQNSLDLLLKSLNARAQTLGLNLEEPTSEM